jgi:hypothetical protein
MIFKPSTLTLPDIETYTTTEMDSNDFNDPLECFQPKNLLRPASDEEDSVIESAKAAINTADRESLTPEIHTKYQVHLTKIIDISPNQIATISRL